MRFGDARSDGSDARFGDEFDADAGLRVGVFQIVDQLGQVFDGVNIVMRRRRNQPDAGSRVTHARNLRIDLVAGQLTTFAGLGSLRDFDLQFLSVDEVMTRHAKSSGSDLLDGAVA
ncbi:MAG: hypothetical protein NVS9B12_15760 [Vulcanimicrobiaceae bacterium]